VAVGAGAAQRRSDRFQRVLRRIHRRRRLVAAMHHAVGAFLVVARAVGIPIGLFHQLLEGLGIAFAEEITGPLPTEIVARGIAPGGAVIALIAGEEIEEERRFAERPRLAAAAAEDVAEELFRL